MVDFSLKKARNNWKNVTGGSPSKSKLLSSPTKGKNKTSKKNPYSEMKDSFKYSELPTMDARERTKVASSMQRRLSVHNPNYAPPSLDFTMPLPTIPSNGATDYIQQAKAASPEHYATQPQAGANEVGNRRTEMAANKANYNASVGGSQVEARTSSSVADKVPADQNAFKLKRGSAIHTVPASAMATRKFPSDNLQPKSLRRLFADPSFNAKTFVHDNLGDATAMEIDKFTSNLTALSFEVQEEVKRNVNRSYREILTVNNDLNVASTELKQLRLSINELMEVMKQFTVLAERRLKVEQEENMAQQSAGLLPPVNSTNKMSRRRDRSSIMIVGKLWDNELNKLIKNVEGAQKLLSSKPGRHILIESENWVELNVATLKPLQHVNIYILNDLVLVAQRKRDKQSEFVTGHCNDLNDATIIPDKNSDTRLLIQFGQSNKTMFQTNDPRECLRLIETFRRAKDDLRNVFQNEELSSKKIKETFSYLSSQQTPNKESIRSPIKTQRRSMGNVTPGRNFDVTDQHLLQSVTMSMHSRTRSADMDSASKKLKHLDDSIEELDISIARLKFTQAVDLLLELESGMNSMANKVVGESQLLYNLVTLKVSQRRNEIISALSTKILNTQDIAPLTSSVKNMCRLSMHEDGLDLFLQNRSNFIQDLILQIGTYDNPTNYLTQIAVIRFQTIKRTALNFQDIFGSSADQFSSILVNWCKNEVDKHFKLIDKQLLNDDMLTPESIKSSRKQIDDLKSVGLDFVYKLDDSIKRNSNKVK